MSQSESLRVFFGSERSTSFVAPASGTWRKDTDARHRQSTGLRLGPPAPEKYRPGQWQASNSWMPEAAEARLNVCQASKKNVCLVRLACFLFYFAKSSQSGKTTQPVSVLQWSANLSTMSFVMGFQVPWCMTRKAGLWDDTSINLSAHFSMPNSPFFRKGMPQKILFPDIPRMYQRFRTPSKTLAPIQHQEIWRKVPP